MERLQDEKRGESISEASSSSYSAFQKPWKPVSKRYDDQNFTDEQNLSWALQLRTRQDKNGEPSRKSNNLAPPQPQSFIHEQMPLGVKPKPESPKKQGIPLHPSKSKGKQKGKAICTRHFDYLYWIHQEYSQTAKGKGKQPLIAPSLRPHIQI